MSDQFGNRARPAIEMRGLSVGVNAQRFAALSADVLVFRNKSVACPSKRLEMVGCTGATEEDPLHFARRQFCPLPTSSRSHLPVRFGRRLQAR